MVLSISFNKCIAKGLAKYNCLECEQKLNKTHFGRRYQCRLCEYRTNCSSACFNHVVEIHSQGTRCRSHQPQIKDVIFESSQMCSCGFKSTNGMILANHLTSSINPDCTICLNLPKPIGCVKRKKCIRPVLKKTKKYTFKSSLSGKFLQKRSRGTKRQVKISSKFHISDISETSDASQESRMFTVAMDAETSLDSESPVSKKRKVSASPSLSENFKKKRKQDMNAGRFLDKQQVQNLEKSLDDAETAVQFNDNKVEQSSDDFRLSSLIPTIDENATSQSTLINDETTIPFVASKFNNNASFQEETLVGDDTEFFSIASSVSKIELPQSRKNSKNFEEASAPKNKVAVKSHKITNKLQADPNENETPKKQAKGKQHRLSSTFVDENSDVSFAVPGISPIISPDNSYKKKSKEVKRNPIEKAHLLSSKSKIPLKLKLNSNRSRNNQHELLNICSDTRIGPIPRLSTKSKNKKNQTTKLASPSKQVTVGSYKQLVSQMRWSPVIRIPKIDEVLEIKNNSYVDNVVDLGNSDVSEYVSAYEVLDMLRV